ncbi:SpoIIE family protein phosphatase [Streptomyces nodosus]|nr:SpoIIE family protein phosphatase [Streptomyces nodosus]MBB4789780.1 PAS domain S-box-containing protein [Streptomyces nodosus]
MRHPEKFDEAAAPAQVCPSGSQPDELPVAGMQLDALGRIVRWDAAAEALLGYPASEVLGSRGELLVRAEGGSGAASLLERVAVGGATTGRCTARHRDGHLVELAVWTYRVPDSGDVLAFLVDVSAVLRTRVPHAVLDGLFRHSPIGLSAFDSELRYLHVNTALETINGVPEVRHLGRRLSEVLPEVNGAEVESVMERVLDTGEPVVDFRATGRTPATPYEDRMWSCSYFRLEDAWGHPFGVGASVVDITARLRAEQAAAASRRRLDLLNEASTRVGTTLDMRQTAQELADVVLRGLADIATVDLIAGVVDDATAESDRDLTGGIVVQRLGKAPARGSPAARALAPLGAILHYPADAPYAQAVARREPFVVAEVDEHTITAPSCHTSAVRQLRELGVYSLLMVPLLARGRVLGVTTLFREFPARRFSSDDVTLARDIASRAAVHLDNAHLYAREHETAVTLQRSLLPQQLTPPPGIEVAHCYRPASDVNEVGGDWYDVVAMPEGRAALAVGDVMGHGIAAAATMGQLRSAMQALARLALPPGQLLRQLDTGLADLPDAALATCTYAVCDPAAGSCSITRAGHLPPAVVRDDGTAELLELPAGAPLGVGGIDFVPTELTLPPGSMLVLYTDGLVEARCADIDQRLTQLLDVLSANAGLPLDGLSQAVMDGLAPAPDDDVALLLARICPPKPGSE